MASIFTVSQVWLYTLMTSWLQDHHQKSSTTSHSMVRSVSLPTQPLQPLFCLSVGTYPLHLKTAAIHLISEPTSSAYVASLLGMMPYYPASVFPASVFSLECATEKAIINTTSPGSERCLLGCCAHPEVPAHLSTGCIIL